jgi:hypothetical protein
MPAAPTISVARKIVALSAGLMRNDMRWLSLTAARGIFSVLQER